MKEEKKVEITDAWIREEVKRRRQALKVNPRAKFTSQFTCTREKGFVVWFAKDLTVSLVCRTRVKVPGVKKAKRPFIVLGHWVDPKEIKSDVAMTVAKAKVKAVITRAGLEQNGLAIATEMPTLSEAIERYVIARRDERDPRTSKRRAPLPAAWDENIARFKKMYAKFITGPCSALTYDNMLEARNEFIRTEFKLATVTDEGLRKVRSIFTTVLPMLKWFRDAKGYMPHAGMIEALTPEAYPKNTRFLYPGEWQASLPTLDLLHDCSGEFYRFIMATGARAETALGMKWPEVDLENPDSFTDANGREHDCVVWIVPRNEKGRMKGRGKKVNDELDRRILLCGESLRIVREMRKLYEARREHDVEYRGVWPKEMLNRWRYRRSKNQRDIERAAGTVRWNRYTLRKTHATLLEYLHCPGYLISTSLTHTAPQGITQPLAAAPVTDHYTFADAARRLQGKDDPLYQLGPWLLKLHQLMHDIETGHLSKELAAIQSTLRSGSQSADMRDRYGIDRKFIDITVKSKPPELRMVGA